MPTDLQPVAISNPCPVCGAGLCQPITSCPYCYAPHHAECWHYNGGCSIYACPFGPEALQSLGSPGEADPESDRADGSSGPPAWASPGVRQVARAVARVVLCVLVFTFTLDAMAALTRPLKLQIETKADFDGYSCLGFRPSRAASVHTVVTPADDPGEVVHESTSYRGRDVHVVVRPLETGRAYVLRAWASDGMCDTSDEIAVKLHPRSRAPAVPAAIPRPLPGLSDRIDWAHPAPQGPDPAPVLRMQIPGSPTPQGQPFGTFDLSIGRTICRMHWRTVRPARSCRVVVSRDESLKGIERALEASSRERRHAHRVNLTNLAPGTSYQVIVLGFSDRGEPIQSPIICFRTLSR